MPYKLDLESVQLNHLTHAQIGSIMHRVTSVARHCVALDEHTKPIGPQPPESQRMRRSFRLYMLGLSLQAAGTHTCPRKSAGKQPINLKHETLCPAKDASREG